MLRSRWTLKKRATITSVFNGAKFGGDFLINETETLMRLHSARWRVSFSLWQEAQDQEYRVIQSTQQKKTNQLPQN